jgi:hypothetical protein
MVILIASHILQVMLNISSYILISLIDCLPFLLAIFSFVAGLSLYKLISLLSVKWGFAYLFSWELDIVLTLDFLMAFFSMRNRFFFFSFFKHFYCHVVIVQGVSLWHFHTCLQCILVRFTHTIILPHSLPPYLKWLQQVSMFSFSYKHIKYINQV